MDMVFMESMTMVLGLLDTLDTPPLSQPDLPRDLASVVLMLNPVMDITDMELVLVFLTMEPFMAFPSSMPVAVTPSNMLPVASIVLMLRLMLAMDTMDILMDMLIMDMDMAMDMVMAMDMDTMVSPTVKLLCHQF